MGKELGRSRVCGLTFQRGSASTRGTGKGGAALRPGGGRGPGGGPKSPPGGNRGGDRQGRAVLPTRGPGLHPGDYWERSLLGTRAPRGRSPAVLTGPLGSGPSPLQSGAVPSLLSVGRKEGLCPGPSWVGVRKGRGARRREGGREGSAGASELGLKGCRRGRCAQHARERGEGPYVSLGHGAAWLGTPGPVCAIPRRPQPQLRATVSYPSLRADCSSLS